MDTIYEKIIGILAGVVVVGLLAWGFVSNRQQQNTPVVLPPVTQTPVVPQVQSISEYLQAPMLTADHTKDWAVYADAVKKFSSRYPKDFTVNGAYVNNMQGSNDVRSGVSFTVPASLTLGTNLSKDSLISIEEKTNASVCEAKSFVDVGAAADKQSLIKIGDTAYTIIKTGDAGAGNLYEQIVVAIPGETCRGVRLFIHSTNIANYDPGTVKQFDREALVSIFETMVASYKAL